MGTLGGSLILGVGIVLGTGKVNNTFAPYFPFFLIVAAIMISCLLVFMFTVKEKKFVEDMEEQSRAMGINEEAEIDNGEKRKLSKAEFKSLILILSSVVLWFFGYNAVTSKYSVYAGQVLNLDYNSTLLVANIAALIAFIPVGIISSKIGRKKSILAGVVMLTTAFFVASFMRNGTSVVVMMLLFVLAGIGWATINVNSFPMVAELARGGDVGKYTGFYYTASMAAQTLTPVLSGVIMKHFGMTKLFPYAAVFAGAAFFTMLFVKHGDSKPEQQGVLESLAGADD
jgi:MFS family permease